MTMVTIDIPIDIYQKLEHESTLAGKSREHMLQEWVVERVTYAEPAEEREHVRGTIACCWFVDKTWP